MNGKKNPKQEPKSPLSSAYRELARANRVQGDHDFALGWVFLTTTGRRVDIKYFVALTTEGFGFGGCHNLLTVRNFMPSNEASAKY